MDSYDYRRFEKDINLSLKGKHDNHDEITYDIMAFVEDAYDEGYSKGNENGYEDGFDEGETSKKYGTELSEKQENYIFRELDVLTNNTDLTNKIMDLIHEGLKK